MAGTAAWKNHERRVARVFNGKRSGNCGRSVVDVAHPIFSIECKFRKTLPQLLREGLDQAHRYDENKLPVLVIKERYAHGAFVVMKMRDFASLFGSLDEQIEE
jgi:hypothetical protein